MLAIDPTTSREARWERVCSHFEDGAWSLYLAGVELLALRAECQGNFLREMETHLGGKVSQGTAYECMAIAERFPSLRKKQFASIPASAFRRLSAKSTPDSAVEEVLALAENERLKVKDVEAIINRHQSPEDEAELEQIRNLYSVVPGASVARSARGRGYAVEVPGFTGIHPNLASVRASLPDYQAKVERFRQSAGEHQSDAATFSVDWQPFEPEVSNFETLLDDSSLEAEEEAIAERQLQEGDRVIIHNNIYGKAGREAIVEQVQGNGWFTTSEGVYNGKYLEFVGKSEEGQAMLCTTEGIAPQELTQSTDRTSHIVRVCTSAKTDQQYTPKEIWEAVIRAEGRIDLDCCSNSHENPNVPAEHHYTVEDNGLIKLWFGVVFGNFPYSIPVTDEDGNPVYVRDEKTGAIKLDRDGNPKVKSISVVADWVNKAVVEIPRTKAIYALVKNDPSTDWFQQIWRHAKAICFIDHRLKFINPGNDDNSAPFSSAVGYFGTQPFKFAMEFKSLGVVVTDWTRPA